ncbi:transcription factor WhiB [Acidimicrobium ferrooxidans DSM 10331]|uniref:Transcriptional regulator WhiB n=1 Tax=Acidimicrobium ferrooxidans (strain DSM 10331 / JCM 15462 / NBRC 103882 / ICP) TaxID=525909 RepID=C7M2P1_ACIFD|nr:WhiB family transcriptional regulator [Acidimicrobium ferrooxidans]ACU53285.1 transcription factor WhiB [Acidimicrobium ferrooxidans DSM 10331]
MGASHTAVGASDQSSAGDARRGPLRAWDGQGTAPCLRTLRFDADDAGLRSRALSGEWQREARCRGVDPRTFFPERGGSATSARRICAGCGVRLECLEFALVTDERFGIWGGLSELERRSLRARRFVV